MSENQGHKYENIDSQESSFGETSSSSASSSDDSIEPVVCEENELPYCESRGILLLLFLVFAAAGIIFGILLFTFYYLVFTPSTRNHDFVDYQTTDQLDDENLSNFGMNKYECEGTCLCLNEENERRTAVAVGQKVAYKLATAFVSAASVIYAFKQFSGSKGLEACRTEFGNDCNNEDIFFDEDSVICRASISEKELEQIVIEQTKGKAVEEKAEFEFDRYECTGHCLINPDSSAKIRPRDCEKETTSGKIYPSFQKWDTLARRDMEAVVEFEVFKLRPFCKQVGLTDAEKTEIEEKEKKALLKRRRKKKVEENFTGLCVSNYKVGEYSNIFCKRMERGEEEPIRKL